MPWFPDSESAEFADIKDLPAFNIGDRVIVTDVWSFSTLDRGFEDWNGEATVDIVKETSMRVIGEGPRFAWIYESGNSNSFDKVRKLSDPAK